MAKPPADHRDAPSPIAPYSRNQLDAIWATVKWKRDAPLPNIEQRFCAMARYYWPLCRVQEEVRPPSVLIRELVGFRGRVTAVIEGQREFAYVANRLPSLKADAREILEVAAADLARQSGNTCDLAELVSPDQSRLDVLHRVVEQAIERLAPLTQEHHRGPNKALHSMIRALHRLYFEHAAKPRGPGANIGEGDENDRTWREGEMLDFMCAALAPLGVGKSREAIYKHWRRATGSHEAPPFQKPDRAQVARRAHRQS